MRPLRLALACAAAAVVLPLAWLAAGLPEHAATEVEIGVDPVDVAVASDDRIVAALLDTAAVTVSWLDSAAFGEGPFTVGLSGDEARCLEPATVGGDPVLFVGGSQVDVLRFDTTTVPADGPGIETPIGLGGGLLVAMQWAEMWQALFAADADGHALRRIDMAGDPPIVDGEAGWPLALPWAPRDVVLLDASTLLVAGDGGLALVDLSSAPPALSALPSPPGAEPGALAGDGAGRAWVVLESGGIWKLVEADPDPGDDDSASDDDSSADDDSADDDSADDDDSSGTGWGWDYVAAGPADASDIEYREVDGTDVLYVAGGNRVEIVDPAGGPGAAFAVSGAVSAIAASSSSDGFVYAATETDQVAILSAGPWVRLDSAAPRSISQPADEMAIEFTATFGAQGVGSCSWSLAIDAEIDGGGTALGPSGTASAGVPVQVTLTGEDLAVGSHRVWIFCADEDGDTGRTSFAYESTILAVPTGFSLAASEGQVTASWDDDLVSSTFVLYFDVADFDEDEDPVLCNADSSICSPHVVVPDRAGEAREDDDDCAASDDDTGEDRITVEVDGLTNGQPYWFAVAGQDAGGEDGPRTTTRQATPSRTGGAAVLAGDEGGCSCQNPGAGVNGALVPVLLLSLLLPLRREARR